MQMVGSKPFLEYVIFNLKVHGVTDIVLAVGYLSDVIRDHFGDGQLFGVRIRYVVEEKPAGTAGALLNCASLLEDWFYLINGDTIFDADLNDLAKLCRGSDKIGALALRTVSNVFQYGEVEVQCSIVTKFAEKKNSCPGLVSGGIAVLSNRVVAYLSSSPCSMERDVFPALVSARQLLGREYSGFFLDIGLPETLSLAQSVVVDWRKRKLV